MSSPTISAVVPAYNSERYIAETLTAILSQSRPPDEVIVVDDGSTDGTLGVVAGFSGDVRVVRQANRGVAGAMNTCFEEARHAYVAKCDADDVWELDKLERQVETLRAHPEVDVAITGARFFGLVEGPRSPYPGEGLLDPEELAGQLYEANFICSCTTMIRRELFQELGRFDEEIACEDYDFWLRALEAGAQFHYDPRLLVRCRAHPEQVSADVLRMHEAEYVTHRIHSGVAMSRRVVERQLARDLSNVGRELRELDRAHEARTAFLSSLRHRPTLRVLGWVIVLSLPAAIGRPLADRLVSIKRTVLSAFRRRASSQAST